MTQASAKQEVTVESFVRAESDKYFKAFVDQGGFGRFFHLRQPTPVAKQDVIRMNRDTLYSLGVFDLAAGPLTLHKPDAGGRFQSIQIVNQDHYSLATVYDPGTYTFTQEDVGTRYVLGLIRTFVDANNPADVQRAHVIQDQTTASQAAPGAFEVPDWDQEALARLRDALNVLAATLKSNEGSFGKPGEVDPLRHLLFTAYGWGGNPLEDAIYLNIVPEQNDGTTPHAFTVKDVPVDGFWSITVYNQDGYLEPNNQHLYAYNNVTAAKNADGSITITFGRGADAVNNLPITPGWNYVVRLYRPRPEVLDGAWTFPKAMPVGERRASPLAMD
ncbi:MAG: DUF1214 domain-containing protein [Chloroflexales bacterium]|nr:DUF1214 domain-containing protein [Chloroflexales bacterium]